MSCEVTYSTFIRIETEEVKIECCNKKEIEKLEDCIISSITQKLEKINILIKNCNVYAFDGNVLVNDRYNICTDLISVAEAFGLTIKQIQCGLRGKNYIITDKLLSVLKQFERTFEFGNEIANQELTDLVKSAIEENKHEALIDAELLSMVQNIKKNGQYVTSRKREVIEDYEDDLLVGRSEGEWISDADSIRNKLINVSKEAQETINQTNSQLRDGTAKLIYTRARQMGYSVQEVKKGTQTQLVLVRCE